MAKVIIDLDKCLHVSAGCSRCIEECPMQMLEVEWFSQSAQFVYEDELCIECRNCEVTCPVKVIEIVSVDLL